VVHDKLREFIERNYAADDERLAALEGGVGAV
jgi:hypothetical protein